MHAIITLYNRSVMGVVNVAGVVDETSTAGLWGLGM
jgi:hypothetical protein